MAIWATQIRTERNGRESGVVEKRASSPEFGVVAFRGPAREHSLLLSTTAHRALADSRHAIYVEVYNPESWLSAELLDEQYEWPCYAPTYVPFLHDITLAYLFSKSLEKICSSREKTNATIRRVLRVHLCLSLARFSLCSCGARFAHPEKRHC